MSSDKIPSMATRRQSENTKSDRDSAFVLILMVFVFVFLFSLANSGLCEGFRVNRCVFAVSSEGNRCMLKRHAGGNGFDCTTTDMKADRFKNWIESGACIQACGLHRYQIGMSFYSSTARRVCSEECYDNCPNIVDLYSNLADREGVDFSRFCEASREKEKAGTESSERALPQSESPEYAYADPSMGTKCSSSSLMFYISFWFCLYFSLIRVCFLIIP